MRKAGAKHVPGCSKYSYDESNGRFTTSSFNDLGLDNNIIKVMVQGGKACVTRDTYSSYKTALTMYKRCSTETGSTLPLPATTNDLLIFTG